MSKAGDVGLDEALRLHAQAKNHERLAAEAYQARREALIAAKAAGASYGQIAEKLGITRGGAQSLIRFAKDD